MNTVPIFGLTIIVFVLIFFLIIFIVAYTLLQKLDSLKCPECREYLTDTRLIVRWIPFKYNYQGKCGCCKKIKRFSK